MNWDAVGAISEFVGAIAVIGSVLYAAVQIRGNSAATRSQTVGEYISDYNSYLRQISENAELSDLMRRAFSDFEGLPKNDQMRAHASLSALLLNATFLYASVQSKTTEDWLAIPGIAFFSSIVKTPGGAQWWSKIAPTIDSEFKRFIDRMETSSVIEQFSWFGEDDA